MALWVPKNARSRVLAALPEDEGWQFEPKWDGFRALVLRQGDKVEIVSKSGKSLARYFPEVVALVAAIKVDDFILDGEIILPVGDVLSFDALRARLHPAASRITKLSHETPAQLMLFDCLMLEGEDPLPVPLSGRRSALEEFHRHHGGPSVLLSEKTANIELARAWLARSGGRSMA